MYFKNECPKTIAEIAIIIPSIPFMWSSHISHFFHHESKNIAIIQNINPRIFKILTLSQITYTHTSKSKKEAISLIDTRANDTLVYLYAVIIPRGVRKFISP